MTTELAIWLGFFFVVVFTAGWAIGYYQGIRWAADRLREKMREP